MANNDKPWENTRNLMKDDEMWWEIIEAHKCDSNDEY